MPRRTSTRTVASTSHTPRATSPAHSPSNLPLSSNVVQLRQQWKWAAFSQFFFTFERLFAMKDVTLVDIEDDLTGSTNIFIPRVMQRLLYTLTQDRKISLDNWQTALRKQYLRRDPEASPFGPELLSNSAALVPAASRPSAERTEASRTGAGVSRSVSPMSVASPVQETLDEHSDRPSLQHREEHSTDPAREADSKDFEDWLDLPMLVKLDSMHALIEWQFQKPLRLRAIMKNDDEVAEWRIEPLGYDAKGNAYWLIGDDRLWIQRALPQSSNLKRKRSASGAASNGRTTKGQSTKRQRSQPGSLTQAVSDHSARNTIHIPAQIGSGSRGGRAAKLQANMKLDAQAKELSASQRQAVGTGINRTGMKPPTGELRRPVGTRVSARLRADIAEEEWQPVPAEWLAEERDTTGESSVNKGAAHSSGVDAKLLSKVGLGSDEESISDLTELTEDQDEQNAKIEPDYTENASILAARLKRASELEEQPLPEGFIEWETICVTLHEWDHIAERFEEATRYAEKALHKVLVHSIVPAVTGELREVDRKRQLEEAIVHRKRSSRIAIKESEREEARTAARRRAEETEKMSRARRLEVRLEKEEADRERREAIREQRRKEREANEVSQKQEYGESTDIQIDVVGNGHQNNGNSQGKIQLNGTVNGSGSGSRTPVGDDWELDCEICHRRGVNQDDGTPMMSCGACSKWQHINCHDRADIEAGHEKRNWDTEEFTCRTCRTRVPNTTGAYRLDPKDSHAATQSPRNGPYTNNRGLYVPRPVDYMSAKSSENLTGTRNYPAATNSGYYERQLSHGSGSPGSLNHTTHTQPYQPHATIPFTYHQPDQRGFATSQAHQLHPSETSNSSQPPPSSPHFPQHPNAGSHPPGSFRHIHDREPVPHIQATNSAEWNVPLPSRNRSYSSYNGVTTLPASRYLQERDTCVGQQPGAVQWQPSDQPLQLPAFPYHQTALFHTPFQTPQ